MLTNLLKYEFKASGRVVLPIASGVLVLNIFTGILSHFIQNTSDRFPLAGLALEAYCRQGYLRHGVDRVRYVIFFRLLCAAYRRFYIQRPSC